MIHNGLGLFMSILLMSFAISVDAFSLSIGLGMQKLHLRRRLFISFIFGFFHGSIPLLGFLTGKILSNKIGHYASIAGGSLLLVIGILMILNPLVGEQDNKYLKPYGAGVFLLAISVSIDSFPVGMSLGLSGVQIVYVLSLFALVSAWLTWIALLIGRNVHEKLGAYSEILGGSILIAFGLSNIFMS